VKCKVRQNKAFLVLTRQCSSVLQNTCIVKICSSVFFSEVQLVADNLLTTLWIRIGRISADNPARRFGCYSAATVKARKHIVSDTWIKGTDLPSK
jgi:hypothetical protein